MFRCDTGLVKLQFGFGFVIIEMIKNEAENVMINGQACVTKHIKQLYFCDLIESKIKLLQDD